MKKNLIVVCLILVTTITTQAQIFKLGLKGGINYANQSGSEIIVNNKNYKSEAISSYHIGLISQIKLSEGFALQPELIYSTVGTSYKPISVAEDIRNELGYVAIPLIAKINLNNTFSIELGPQASFLLSEKNKVTISDQKSFDFALTGGIGINITKSIFVQGRYGLGLTEVSPSAETKNSVLQVSAGFMF